MNFKLRLFGLLVITFLGCTPTPQRPSNDVKIVGQMKNVMLKGQLHGNIDLDTISDKKNLYGIGPVEYLKGELMILDGKAYRSAVETDTTMLVVESFDNKAPFFGYANISEWTEYNLPDSIYTNEQIEQYLQVIASNSKRPFLFKLSGTIDHATIHIVNLPDGSKVSSPAEAHVGQINYQLNEERVEIVGFFSTEHKGIFTHHDTYLHMHLITADRKKMGHLDQVLIKKGSMKMYLPTE